MATRWTIEVRRDLLTRHRGGTTQADLAKEYGISAGRMWQVIQKSENDERKMLTSLYGWKPHEVWRKYDQWKRSLGYSSFER